MLPVLLLFLLPIGGGIPAGVLVAQSKGMAWPLTAGLYLLSDIVQAAVLEPVIRGLIRLGRRQPALARFGVAFQAALAHSASPFLGRGTGPFALIALSFGLDPITGRIVAMAADYGCLGGWACAIAGDMLYYGVIALATLRLNHLIHNPTLTVGVIFLLMFLVPVLVRRARQMPLPEFRP